MKNTNPADNALIQKQGQQPNNGDKDQKIVNEQEQHQVTNDEDNNDKDKQYDEQNKDRSWKGGKEEENIGPERPDEQTDDSDETEKKS